MINSCCSIFQIIPEDQQQEPVKLEDVCQGCRCHCGYIQFEQLVPYMDKLSNRHVKDDDYIKLEAKLRQQIIEVSRLFDESTNAEHGQYAKAHLKVIDLYANGTSYLKIPEFVKGSLKLYKDGYLINPSTYAYKDGYLIFMPCHDHTRNTCGCTNTCGQYQPERKLEGWKGCLQAQAQFGKECADFAVQLAVKSYMIELASYGDPIQTLYNGLPIARKFQIPHAWSALVDKYLQKKKRFFGFGVA